MKNNPIYIQIYQEYRDKIIAGIFPEGSKLPSKRTVADQTGASIISVEHAFSILCDEGYAEARQRSGYYVIYEEKNSFSAAPPREISAQGRAPVLSADPQALDPQVFDPQDLDPQAAPLGTPDSAISLFPFSVYARTMRKVLSEYGERILEKSPNNGCLALRSAISRYLARSRGISVPAERIVIGSGAEYLYGLIVKTLGWDRRYAIEKPSYEKIEQVYKANGISCDLLALGKDGILSGELAGCQADVLHITPYRSFPSGVTATASKRREYLRWANAADRFIVEDDFGSEFTPSSKPEETLYALSEGGRVIYVNTFSKTLAPSIRIGYMLLPESLVPLYENRAGFFSCSVPTYDQYVLAEFIDSGDFERHLNRVRRSIRRNNILLLPEWQT